MKTVLVYSEEYKQMEKMLDVLEQNGFNSIPCLSLEDTIQCINLTIFDLLIFTGNLPDTSKNLIKKQLNDVQPTVSIFELISPIENLVLDIKQALALN